MSSTDDDDARARRFFGEHLLPAAAKLRERGVHFFPLGPDDAESWFETPPEGDFVEFGDLEAALRQLWQAQGLPELEALAQPLAKLADELEIREQDASEISPFVYVMY